MKLSKPSAVFLLQIFLSCCNFSNGCNFGFGNLGIGNFGAFNVGFGNKGFLNAGLLNIGFAQKGIRNIGALNFLPIPNTISIFNVPVYPNLTPPIGRRRRRRSTLHYPSSTDKKYPWMKINPAKAI